MLKKKKISESYVEKFWLELYDWDDIPREIRGLNLNNIDSINKLVKEFLYIRLLENPISIQYKIKESFRYAINFWDENKLIKHYQSVMPILSLPSTMSCLAFYKYVWSLMFPGESYTIKNKFDYTDIGPMSAF